MLSGQVFNDKADSLHIALQTAKSTNLKTDVLLELSDVYSGLDNLQAYKFALEAYSLNVNSGETEYKWKSSLKLSKAFQNLDSVNQSHKLALEALNISRELADEEKIAISLRILGGHMLSLGSYQMAGEYLYEALDHFERMKDSMNISTVNILIGIIHYKLNNPHKALEYYRNGLDLATISNNRTNISAAINNIAAIYENLEDYEQALYYFQKALKLNQQSDNVLWTANNYLNIGIVNYRQQKYDDGLTHFYRAISLYDSLDSEDGLASAWIYIGKVFFQMQQNDSAYFYASKAMRISKKNNLTDELMQTSLFLGEYFKTNNVKDSATHYTMLYYQLRDSLNSKEYLLQVSKLEQQYDFQKQQQTLALQQQRKDFVKILFIGGLSALLLIIGLLYSRLKISARHNKLKKHQLERELEFKNQENAADVIALMKRNEIISKLLIKLKTVEDSASKQEVKNAIRKISAELRLATEKDILPEFELRFKEVHKDFYDKLISNYPDLWPSELKLCAFLKLNMTTKEISELTGQTPASIEKARYRLRRKLHITGSDTNLVSFLSAL
jgi:tetratricopeptide (TPR) repeat protein